MSDTHFTMQGKGGVGKTFTASILAQFFAANLQEGRSLRLIDTDPVNATFSQYKAFEVMRLELQEGTNSQITTRKFDQLLEMMLTDDQSTFVVDNGAASFLPLSHYMIENKAIEMMLDAGRTVWIHPVITGGLGQDDTLSGLDHLARQMPAEVKIVVWKNPYFGRIEKGGKPFEEMPVYKNHAKRLHAVINIPDQSADTFGEDVKTMLQQKLTFDQAIGSEAFGIMSRQRLKITKEKLFSSIAPVFA